MIPSLGLVAAVGVSGAAVYAVEEVLPPWAQAGILGLLILGFVTKQIVPGWLYADIRAELKEVRASEAGLVQTLLDTNAKTLPALEASTTAVSEAMTELRVLRQHQGRP